MTKTKLADRVNILKAEGAYAVLSESQALERKGKSIIHFEIGQPDFDTPKHIVDAAIKALKSGKTKYTPSLGIMALRQQLALTASKFRNKTIDYSQVAVTPSGKTAIFVVLAAVVNPGDEVIYPDPGFPAYRALIDFFGGRPVPIPLVEENHFSFDMKMFKKYLTKKTKLVILNSPSNPTGGVMPKSDIEDIAELVGKTQAFVMTDEMYSTTLYSGEPYVSIYSLPKMENKTIIVDGFSKTYAMTGWRLGYVVAPKFLIEKIDHVLTHTVGCTASFTQEAGVAALTGPRGSIDVMVREFKKRRDFVVSSLNTISGIHCEVPEGAFYVFPNVKAFKKTSKYIASYLLNNAGVAVLDGASFGTYGEGHLRISYATSMELLHEGITRMKKSLRHLQ